MLSFTLSEIKHYRNYCPRTARFDDPQPRSPRQARYLLDKVRLLRMPTCTRISCPTANSSGWRLPVLPQIRISGVSSPHIGDVIDRWWNQRFIQAPHIVMTVDKIEICMELVKHGLGYALVAKRRNEFT